VNNDIRYALEYHEATKHSEISIQTSGHYLDWDNKPRPFKIYTKLPSISLPQDFCKPSLDAITSISKIKSITESTATTTTTTTTSAVDIKKLAEILFFSAGITREMNYPYGTYYMRAASATGALYPIELYVVCQDIPGLRAGVYHFCPGDFTLTELRNGDYRGKLSAAAGESKNIMASPIIIIFSSIAWRNAWKYQARSYRHWFWDSGVIAANLLGTTVSNNIRSFLIMGFVDDIVNRMLLLDDKREAAIAMAAIDIGLSKNQVGSNFKEIISSSSLPSPEVLPLSKKADVEYPEIWRVHQASSLSNTEEVKQWSNSASSFKKQDRTSRAEILNSQPLQYEEPSSSSSFQPGLGDVILLRGSSRRFARKPISFMQISTILHASTRGIPLDFLGQDGDRTAIDVYMIVNDVEGLERGSYFFNRSADSLEQLKRNVPRNMSGYLCLGQNLFSDASIVFFLMTDLLEVLSTYGNRGYRAAQFEAGIVAGKIYLSSYAQQLGASGSTFFDDAVSEFFSPHAKDKSTMIAVGVGIPGYKARPGKILAGTLSKSQIIKEAF
jgi:SagB-type dehydrogenase family enzyme